MSEKFQEKKKKKSKLLQKTLLHKWISCDSC